MKICPKCHFENEDSAEICSKCKTSLSSSDQIPLPPDPHLQIPESAPGPQNHPVPPVVQPEKPLPPVQPPTPEKPGPKKKLGWIIGVLIGGIVLGGGGVLLAGSAGLFLPKENSSEESKTAMASEVSEKEESNASLEKSEASSKEKEPSETSESPKSDISPKSNELPAYEGLTVYKTNHNMHVRSRPSTSAESIGSVAQGGQAVVNGYVLMEGGTWGKLQDVDGWICINDGTTQLLTPISQELAPEVTWNEAPAFDVLTAQYNMKLRQGPSTSTDQVGSIKQGEQVRIDSYQQEGDSRWGHVYQSDGWICISDPNYIYLK